MNKYFQIVLLALLIPLFCNAEEIHHSPVKSDHSDVVDLSPNLRDLLSQEMRELQKGMIEIHPLYISGKWAEIVPIAKKMKNSYLLKQKLTKEQMHELHLKLPANFIELDQQFHYLAGMLAHAATMKKTELVGFYFSKMSESCVSCHSQFATHKFPSFIAKKQVHEH